MGIYKVNYLKFEFSNKVIDEDFYFYLRETTPAEIISKMKDFRRKEVSELQADHYIERICLLIGRILFLVGFSSFIVIVSYDEVPFSEFISISALGMFPALFLLSFTLPYALTMRELKKGIKKRQKNLLKAEKMAKSSNTFLEFLDKITIK